MNVTKEKICNDLIKIANSINNLYDKLSQLEAIGLKDEQEYAKTLDYLVIAIEVENELYNRLSINEIKDILNYLDDDDKFSFDLTRHELIYKRIIVRLNKLIKNNQNELLIQNLRKRVQYTMFENYVNQEIDDIIDQNDTFLNNFKHYLLQIFYNILSNEKNNNLKYPELFKQKYYLCNASSEIEKEAVRESFNNLVAVNPQWLLLINNTIDEELFEILLNAYALRIANQVIISLLSVEKEDQSTILMYYFLRSLFVIINEEELTELNYNYHKFTDDNEVSSIGNKFIIQAFKNINHDKNKYKGIITKQANEKKI